MHRVSLRDWSKFARVVIGRCSGRNATVHHVLVECALLRPSNCGFSLRVASL